MATPLDPDPVAIEPFPTQDEPNLSSTPAAPEPPTIRSSLQ